MSAAPSGVDWAASPRKRLRIPHLENPYRRERRISHPVAKARRGSDDPQRLENSRTRLARNNWRCDVHVTLKADIRQHDWNVLRATHWTLHNLRRTVATSVAELGVLPHVIECVLNHLSGLRSGVAGIYQRHRYLPEMREALPKWADHVEAITGKLS